MLLALYLLVSFIVSHVFEYYKQVQPEANCFLRTTRLDHSQKMRTSRRSHSLMFFKIGVLKNFAIICRKTLVLESLFNKVAEFQALRTATQRPATLLKRNYNTGVFLWILKIFKNRLFYRTSPAAASEHHKNKAQPEFSKNSLWKTIIFFTFFLKFSFSPLKLASAIFYQIFISQQIIVVQKLWKVFLISSKKLFSFSSYSSFCISVFPSFSPCQPLL